MVAISKDNQVSVIWPEALFALVLIVVNLLISMYPPLEQARGQLMAIFGLIGALVIGGQLALRFQNSTGVPFLKMPLFGPLWLLLSSRKFLVAVSTLITAMLVAQIPELESVRSELIAVFAIVGSALVVAIAHEDRGKTTPEAAPAAPGPAPSEALDGEALVRTVPHPLTDTDYQRVVNTIVSMLRIEFREELMSATGSTGEGPVG